MIPAYGSGDNRPASLGTVPRFLTRTGYTLTLTYTYNILTGTGIWAFLTNVEWPLYRLIRQFNNLNLSNICHRDTFTAWLDLHLDNSFPNCLYRIDAQLVNEEARTRHRDIEIDFTAAICRSDAGSAINTACSLPLQAKVTVKLINVHDMLRYFCQQWYLHINELRSY